MIFEDTLPTYFVPASGRSPKNERDPLLKDHSQVMATRYTVETGQDIPYPGCVVAVAGPQNVVVWDTSRPDVNSIGVVVASAAHIRDNASLGVMLSAHSTVLIASHGDVVVNVRRPTQSIGRIKVGDGIGGIKVGDTLCPSGQNDGTARVHSWYRGKTAGVFGRVVSLQRFTDSTPATKSINDYEVVVARVTELVSGPPREVRCSATGAALCVVLVVVAVVWLTAHFLSQ